MVDRLTRRTVSYAEPPELSSGALRAATMLVHDAVLLAGPDGRIVFANPAAMALLGSEVIGARADALFTLREDDADSTSPDGTSASRACLARARRGEVQRRQGMVRRATGERLPVSLQMDTPSDMAGSVVIVIHDRSPIAQAQEQERLRHHLNQAQKSKAIGQLVSGVAHELNNPLAAVMAYAQLVLCNAQLGRDDQQALETIVQETKRAATIIANLLTFARQRQPERAVTDINQIVRDTLALRQYWLSHQHITLTVQLDDALPLTMADTFQLQQVLLNLISNAEQALERWEGTRTLTVATAYRNEHIELTVADSGPGIADVDLEQIFNPFFTTRSVGDGVGLGLAVSDGIVREHSGRLRVESVPGAGATFTVELPHIDPSSACVGRPSPASAAPAYITERAS
jgi:C4-dicarboxylate-specific signal transduction histidine kinase